MGVNMLITPVDVDRRFFDLFLGNHIQEVAKMRTIKELYSLAKKVYLYLGSTGAYNDFKNTAAQEGFKLPEGQDDVLALQDDWSFCHTGFVGHFAFHSSKAAKGIIRVNYAKWITGADDYLYHEGRAQ